MKENDSAMRDNLSKRGQIVMGIIKQHSVLNDITMEQSVSILDEERVIAKQTVTQYWKIWIMIK